MSAEPEDVGRRLEVTKLEAKLVLLEMQRESLNREIASHTLSYDLHSEAIKRRDELQSECAWLVTELETLRQSYTGNQS